MQRQFDEDMTLFVELGKVKLAFLCWWICKDVESIDDMLKVVSNFEARPL